MKRVEPTRRVQHIDAPQCLATLDARSLRPRVEQLPLVDLSDDPMNIPATSARRVGVLDGYDCGDDAIVIDGCTVLWVANGGSIVRRRFSFDSRVVDAVWTQFALRSDVVAPEESAGGSSGAVGDVGGPRRGVLQFSAVEEDAPVPRPQSPRLSTCLCVLRVPNIIFVYSLSGATYTTALPCEASSLFSLDQGLLVQAHSGDNVVFGADHGSSSTAGARAGAGAGAGAGVGMGVGVGGSSGVGAVAGTPLSGLGTPGASSVAAAVGGAAQLPPVLFTLMHPVQELRPVASLKRPPRSSRHVSAFAADNLEYVWFDSIQMGRGGSGGGLWCGVQCCKRVALWLVLVFRWTVLGSDKSGVAFSSTTVAPITVVAVVLPFVLMCWSGTWTTLRSPWLPSFDVCSRSSWSHSTP